MQELERVAGATVANGRVILAHLGNGASMAAVLGDVDTLIFSGGIGENAAPIRTRICDGLGFLGIELSASRNATIAEFGNAHGVISTEASKVMVRVMRTDEEVMIAQSVLRILALEQ